jgi:DNA polymerase III subunit alpha
LKNIGALAVQSIVDERSAHGPYTTLADFATRLNPKALNKRAVETLAMAGAFDKLQPDRALVTGNVESILALANRTSANAAAGTNDLFGSSAAPVLDLKPQAPWTAVERLAQEFDGVGFFLSGHPLDQYGKTLGRLGVVRFVDFEQAVERGATAGQLAGIVISARERRSQKGNKFAFAMFSDPSGQFEAVIFSDALAASGDLLEAGTPVLLAVEAERDGEALKMRVQSIKSLNAAAAELETGLKLQLDDQMIAAQKLKISDLKTKLQKGAPAAAKKGGEVRLVVAMDQIAGVKGAREIELILTGKFDVSPGQADQLSALPGVLSVAEA